MKDTVKRWDSSSRGFDSIFWNMGSIFVSLRLKWFDESSMIQQSESERVKKNRERPRRRRRRRRRRRGKEEEKNHSDVMAPKTVMAHRSSVIIGTYYSTAAAATAAPPPPRRSERQRTLKKPWINHLEHMDANQMPVLLNASYATSPGFMPNSWPLWTELSSPQFVYPPIRSLTWPITDLTYHLLTE